MKKEEKTQKTKERIIEAAVEEFGKKNYDTASINSICEIGNISKGLIYHNFKGKDDIYLICVKKSYDKMTEYLKSRSFKVSDPKKSLQEFLIIRQNFFRENPYYANIFFNAVLQPPKHLAKELKQLRKEFDEYCFSLYNEILELLTLRNGITKEIALEYFNAASQMFNEYFRKKSEQSGDYRNIIEDHEERLSLIFDIMFYGIAKESM